MKTNANEWEWIDRAGPGADRDRDLGYCGERAVPGADSQDMAFGRTWASTSSTWRLAGLHESASEYGCWAAAWGP